MHNKPTYEELAQRVEELEERLAEQTKVEQAFLRTRRRINTVFDFVPYPLAVLSPDQKVRYLNSGFIYLFGWTFREMKGKKTSVPAGSANAGFAPPGTTALSPGARRSPSFSRRKIT